MENELRFRPATINDAKLLLDWRNDPETRRQSINSGKIKLEDHIKWLEKVLANKDRKLMIAMIDYKPVGTVRLDIEEPYSEISWTVAPSARGQGIGARMVEEAVRIFEEPLKARIKPENFASIKIAENAGFKKNTETSEITEWILDR